MRVVVFGASGRTGRLAVERALAEGHEVTAFVRERGTLALEHERLRVAEGDVLDPASVEAGVAAAEGTI
ncbi:MAG: NAD(P)H-binding protein, partial [Thermoleophilia bacterium]|nr:NAD(P)H-binding protein [Thermoleophilia bacterium]